jgi:hypothetical protein
MSAPATNQRGHLSSETLDLLLLSALSSTDANSAKAHLDDCERCKDAWRELNEDKQRFDQFVFARTLPKVEARAAAQRRSFFATLFSTRNLTFLVPGGALAAVLVALVVVRLTGGGTQTEDDVYVGIKGGGPTLEIFALRGEARSPFEVTQGVNLQPKDRIRFVVNPGKAKYLLIASRDAAGAFSVYHPYGATESVRIDAQVPRHLEVPNAVELDETLGSETIVAVFSDAPIKAADLEAALKSGQRTLPNATLVFSEITKARP